VQSGRTGTLTLSNLTAGTYDLYLYGQNSSAQTRSSTFTANGLSAVCGPNSSVNVLASPTNYVHLVPTVTSNGVLTITLTGAATGDAQLNGLQLKGPLFIPVLNLASDTTINTKTHTVYAGNNVTFTAAFGGTAPITNQWMLNTGGGFANVSGATSTTLTLTNVQVSDSGNYALFASNAAGSSNSTPLTLTVLAAPTNISLNVQFTGSGFGSGNAPTQTGAAVIGNSGDVWNPVSNPTGGTSPAGLANASGLALVDVSNVTATATLDYVGDYVFNGTAFGFTSPFGGTSVSNLMQGYLGSVSNGNPDTNTITVHNLQPGAYNLYLYSAARSDAQSRLANFSANGQTALCGPNSGNSVLTAGVNYVHLTPTVTTNGLLIIRYYGATAADAGQSQMNGFQLNGPVTLPTLFLSSDTTSDSPATNYAGRTVSFTAAFGGNPTPSYQWEVNKGSGFVNVSASATNATLTLNNVQTTDSGIYALFATNVVGISNSTPLSLTVLSAPTTNFALNVQFAGTSGGSGFAATQVGPAVIGSTGDLWNPVSNPNPVGGDTNPISGSGLRLADPLGIGTTVALAYTGNNIINSGAGTPFNGSGSPAANLMQASLGVANANSGTVTLQGLLPRKYDLYLYSSAGNSGQTRVSQFTANGVTANSGPNSGINVLTQGTNYVHLTPTVAGDGLLNISFVGTVGGLANLNGLQLFYINTAPIAGATFTMNVVLGTPSSVQIVGGKFNPTDANDDVLTITGVTGTTNGTASTDGTNITYTATGAGIDSFTYTVDDGFGGSASQTVSVVIDSSNGSQTGHNGLSAQAVGGNAILGYAGIPGYKYALDITHDLTVPVTWTPVVTNTAATNGVIGSLSYTNPISGSPTNDFYRTRYVP